jgi:GNAT superfamily N-acetyltransferase
VPKTSVIDPSGAPRDVDDSELAAALQRGWRLPTPEEPQRLSSEAAAEENYGGLRGGVESVVAGIGRGLTLGGSDLALKYAGGKGAADDLLGLQRQNPGLSVGSEILGNVAPFLATGGAASALAKTPAGLLSGVGKAIAEEGGASLGGRALAATAGAAAEGGIQSGATYISQSALEDKPLSAEGFVGAVGHGALWAAPIGGALTLGEAGLIRARKLFPKAQVSAAAAQGIKREATAALVDAATDGEQMAQTARKQLELVDEKAGMATLTEQQTRRAFGAADPGSLGDQVTGGVEKAQLQEALNRYEASKANLNDWIRSEADPDLEAALLGVVPPEVGAPGGSLARGSGPVPNQELFDALDMRARQLDQTAVGKKKVPEALVEGVKEAIPAVGDAPDATRAGKRPAGLEGLLADTKAQLDSGKSLKEISDSSDLRKAYVTGKELDSGLSLSSPLSQFDHELSGADLLDVPPEQLSLKQLRKLKEFVDGKTEELTPGTAEYERYARRTPDAYIFPIEDGYKPDRPDWSPAPPPVAKRPLGEAIDGSLNEMKLYRQAVRDADITKAGKHLLAAKDYAEDVKILADPNAIKKRGTQEYEAFVRPNAASTPEAIRADGPKLKREPLALKSAEYDSMADDFSKSLTPEHRSALLHYSNGTDGIINRALRRKSGRIDPESMMFADSGLTPEENIRNLEKYAGIDKDRKFVHYEGVKVDTSGYEARKISDEVNRIDYAIGRSKLGRDAVVYRTINDPGGRITSSLEPGSTFVEHGYASTSANPNFADEFVPQVGHDVRYKLADRVDFHIKLPAGSHAAPMANEAAGYKGAEEELLLPRGTRFRVTKVEPGANGGPKRVFMEAIGTESPSLLKPGVRDLVSGYKASASLPTRGPRASLMPEVAKDGSVQKTRILRPADRPHGTVWSEHPIPLPEGVRVDIPKVERARESMLKAVSKATKDGIKDSQQAAVRDGLFSIAEAYGMHPRLRGAPLSGALEVMGNRTPSHLRLRDGAAASMHIVGKNAGLMLVDPRTFEDFKNFLSKSPREWRALGEASEHGNREAAKHLNGVHVMNHETVHALGPEIVWDKAGEAIEELTTELASRRITSDAFDVSSANPVLSAYHEIIDPVVDTVSSAVGVTRPTAQKALEVASLRFKGLSGKISSDKAIDFVVNDVAKTLGVPAGKRESLLSAMRDSLDIGRVKALQPSEADRWAWIDRMKAEDDAAWGRQQQSTAVGGRSLSSPRIGDEPFSVNGVDMSVSSETKPLVKGGAERTTVKIERKLADGEVVSVGEAEFIHRGDKLYPESANVDPAWQRKGIGTRMYEEAERITGKKVIPSDNQTPAGAAFNRKYRERDIPGFKVPEKAAIKSGIPKFSDLGSESFNGEAYVVRPSELLRTELRGIDSGADIATDARTKSVSDGWKSGARVPAIEIDVDQAGHYFVADGNHRLFAAAIEGDRPVLARFRPVQADVGSMDRIGVDLERAIGKPSDSLTGLLRGTKDQLDSGIPFRDIRPPEDLGAKILEFGEPQVTKALGKRPGGGTDIGPDIARAAKVITEHESSLAQLADVLGPAAPPTAVSRAQAFRQALNAQSEAYAGSAAKAAQGIDAKVAPAATVGALPAPAVRTTFGGETVVDDQISKALQKETMRRPPAAGDATVVDNGITKALRAHDMKAGRTASPTADAPAGSGVLGKVADVGTALEVLQAMGVHVPDISSIPVIGPVLSLYLKARAVLGILGRKGGSVGRSTESIVAAKSAGLRNRIVTATGGALEVAARGARRAAEVPKAPLAILGMSLFPGGENSKSKDPRVLYEARMNDLARAQQPGAVAQAVADRVQTSDPDLQDAITAQVERGIQFIASKAPKQAVLPGMLPGDGTWKPSKSSLATWSRYINAVNDPASVLEDLARGHLSIEGAEVLRTVYPKLFAEAQKALLEAAPKMQKTLPSSRRIAISIMYQVPVDPSMYPSHLQFLQAQAPGAQPAQPQAPQGGPAITGPLQTGAQTMTALDRRAGM